MAACSAATSIAAEEGGEGGEGRGRVGEGGVGVPFDDD